MLIHIIFVNVNEYGKEKTMTNELLLEDLQVHNFTGDLFHIKYLQHYLSDDSLTNAVETHTGVASESQTLSDINNTICSQTHVGILQKAKIDTL